MAYALIVSVGATPGANGGASSTIDTSGATLLVLTVAAPSGGITVLDSKLNNWTLAAVGSVSSFDVSIYYVDGTPTVGAAHTFTVTGVNIYPAFAAIAYSGSASSPLDATNNGIGLSASAQAGSVTPSEDNELIVVTVGLNGGETFDAVDSGFTFRQNLPFGGGNNYGMAVADLIETTATAKNPAITLSSSTQWRAAIATFKAAAAAGGDHPAARRWGGVPGMSNFGSPSSGRSWFKGLSLPSRRPLLVPRRAILLPSRTLKRAA